MKLIPIIIICILSISMVSAFDYPLDRDYFNGKEVTLQPNTDILVKSGDIGLYKLTDDLLIEIGFHNQDNKKCDEESTDDACLRVGLSIASHIVNGGSALVPEKNTFFSTPFFDLELKDIELDKDGDQTITINLQPTTTQYVNFQLHTTTTLRPDTIGTIGKYSVYSYGIDDYGNLFVDFKSNNELFLPNSKMYEEGKYLPFDSMKKVYPLACLEPDLCLFFKGSNYFRDTPKNSKSVSLQGSEIYVELVQITECAHKDTFCPEGCVFQNDSDCPMIVEEVIELVKNETGEILENETINNESSVSETNTSTIIEENSSEETNSLIEVKTPSQEVKKGFFTKLKELVNSLFK